MKLFSRSDGSFVKFSTATEKLDLFYKTHSLKPIQLLFRTESPYSITVGIGTKRHTLTVQSNYVTDGVSKPISNIKIPNEYEDSYWVYHDYMYQHQHFDDGTRITKRQADDIMHLIIKKNKDAPQWCKLYRLFVNYNNFNKKYWSDLYKRGVCFYIHEQNICIFPKCNAIFHLDNPSNYTPFQN
jgi:hypothetical protein